MNFLQMILIYFICINVITMLIYGIDKLKAIHQRYRIPESTLILLAIAGGSIGALSGMYLFHHKTKKVKFYIGVPLILVCQVGILILLYTKVLN